VLWVLLWREMDMVFFFFDGWVVVGALGVDGLVLMVWVLMVWCWWWMGGFILSVPGMVGYILLKRP
jgi:hypothetical protein